MLAWLPLPGHNISIVWSAPDAMARRNAGACPRDALRRRVADAGNHALGEMIVDFPAAAGFPLSILRLPTTIAHRLALVGDAAHGVHPLAGQGVNLGFGDARVLAQILAERRPVVDPGAPVLLARYARRRVEPVLAMQTVTDGLARLFGPPSPVAFHDAQCRPGRRRSGPASEASVGATGAAIDCPIRFAHFPEKYHVAFQ